MMLIGIIVIIALTGYTVYIEVVPVPVTSHDKNNHKVIKKVERRTN